MCCYNHTPIQIVRHSYMDRPIPPLDVILSLGLSVIKYPPSNSLVFNIPFRDSLELIATFSFRTRDPDGYWVLIGRIEKPPT